MKRIIIILPLALLLLCAGFQKNKHVPVYDKKYIESRLKYIPSGTYTRGEYDTDGPIPEKIHVDSFYLFSEEICNGFYCFYLQQVKNDTHAYADALPDSLLWINGEFRIEPYVDYYLRHPAYAEYPVVGIKYAQCLQFCEWLTQVYNNLPGRKFGKVRFDLPTQNEWEWAARGGQNFAYFPWKGVNMQNEKGDVMANFMLVEQASIQRAEGEAILEDGHKIDHSFLAAGTGRPHFGAYPLDNSDITAPVKSYWPNGYGLYNMSGNVEEFVKENGLSKGGSWHDPGYYLLISSCEKYPLQLSASIQRGFRIAMHVE